MNMTRNFTELNQRSFKNAKIIQRRSRLTRLHLTVLMGLGFFGAVSVPAQSTEGNPGKILYENHFETTELEKVPDEFLVLDGAFAVKQDGTNKFLQLPGAPLETFGVLFGPTLESDMAVTTKIRGTAKGRRFPAFAVGLNGVGGYRLQVSAAKELVELYKGDQVVKTAPFHEKMGAWINLRLQVTKTAETAWKIEGTVWSDGAPEPSEATILFLENTKPIPGRATIWGSPYAGTPIQFDDLIVTSVSGK